MSPPSASTCAGRARLRREPGSRPRRPRKSPRSTSRRCSGRWAMPRRSCMASAMAGPISASSTDLERRCGARSRRATVAKAASFNLSPDKRTTLDFALEHLAKRPQGAGDRARRRCARSARSRSTRQRCTLCMACIGACPESALLDSPETPSLRFIESNCVQCGLCADTCPEDAISAGAAPAPRAAGEGARDAERGRAVQLRALRQALRHAPDGREHARQALGPLDVRRRARDACRCAATAAWST